jgi:hypothetical protein
VPVKHDSSRGPNRDRGDRLHTRSTSSAGNRRRTGSESSSISSSAKASFPRVIATYGNGIGQKGVDMVASELKV